MLRASIFSGIASIRHGFFTRQGGVSEGIFESLNCGLGSSDDPRRVKENRARVAAALETPCEHLLTIQQVHSPETVVAAKPWTPEKAPQADAVITNRPGLAVAVLTADCAPVLLCDPDARVIAAAHAGWRGALAGIIERTLEGMEQLGAKRAQICACIGPAISQSAYEVGSDFAADFLAQDPESQSFFREEDDQPHFDLVGYVAERLRRAGIEAVQELGFCTYCDETRFFSYRRSQHHGETDYGRQISAIVLA